MMLDVATSGDRAVAIVIRARWDTARVNPQASLTWTSINRARHARGWSMERLAREAGVSLSSVQRLATAHLVEARIVKRIRDAANGVLVPPRGDRPTLIRAAYRGFIAALAARCGLALEAIASAKKNQGGWTTERLAIAHCRMRAFYLTVTALDLSMSEVGRAIGLTKQAVSKAMRAVEDARDDPATDALLDQVAAFATGVA